MRLECGKRLVQGSHAQIGGLGIDNPELPPQVDGTGRSAKPIGEELLVIDGARETMEGLRQSGNYMITGLKSLSEISLCNGEFEANHC